jgi:hypothetical protein
MSRVINVDNPGKVRNQQMRTCAEILRHLSQKPALDDDAKDMIAQLYFCLRIISETIEHSSEVWEKRNYWMKAEELRRAWDWVYRTMTDIEQLLRSNDWSGFPKILAALFQHVGSIKIKKLTRSGEDWAGSYQKLMTELK